MDICGEHGEEIAYTGRDCPACEHIEKVRADFKEDLDQQVSDLESQVSDLEFEIEELQERIYELENQ